MRAMGDTLDEVLPRFAACGPEFGQGLSNHGPMAVSIAGGQAGLPGTMRVWVVKLQ